MNMLHFPSVSSIRKETGYGTKLVVVQFYLSKWVSHEDGFAGVFDYL